MKAGSKRVAKQRYVCSGGPWNLRYLYLASAGTLWMNFAGTVGRYARCGHGVLKWEPK